LYYSWSTPEEYETQQEATSQVKTQHKSLQVKTQQRQDYRYLNNVSTQLELKEVIGSW
jgi:hypothetical protein